MTALQKKSIVALWNLSLDEKSQKKSDTHGMVNKTMVTKTKVNYIHTFPNSVGG